MKTRQRLAGYVPHLQRALDALAVAFGDDTRKHAIGLSYVTTFVGNPTPKNEALDFGWFHVDALPDPLWPGCRALIGKMLG